ncbi:MAG TPA: NifB/NifX family molybdenum-iron cluster-binding protein [Bacillota bacterium]
MFLRVAVASTDGKYVNDHFGRAKQFLVFDINGSEYRFLELRQNTPSCNLEGTDENKHLKTVELLADCQAVLVARIGPGAERYLSEHGIKAIVIPDFIEEALKQITKLW